MKKLYDGTEVSDETPTKLTSRGRELLTEKEINDRKQEEVEFKRDMQRNNLLKEIVNIERNITPRRIREAIINKDTAWLSQQEQLIESKRAEIRAFEQE